MYCTVMFKDVTRYIYFYSNIVKWFNAAYRYFILTLYCRYSCTFCIVWFVVNSQWCSYEISLSIGSRARKKNLNQICSYFSRFLCSKRTIVGILSCAVAPRATSSLLSWSTPARSQLLSSPIPPARASPSWTFSMVNFLNLTFLYIQVQSVSPPPLVFGCTLNNRRRGEIKETMNYETMNYKEKILQGWRDKFSKRISDDSVFTKKCLNHILMRHIGQVLL